MAIYSHRNTILLIHDFRKTKDCSYDEIELRFLIDSDNKMSADDYEDSILVINSKTTTNIPHYSRELKKEGPEEYIYLTINSSSLTDDIYQIYLTVINKETVFRYYSINHDSLETSTFFYFDESLFIADENSFNIQKGLTTGQSAILYGGGVGIKMYDFEGSEFEFWFNPMNRVISFLIDLIYVILTGIIAGIVIIVIERGLLKPGNKKSI